MPHPHLALFDLYHGGHHPYYIGLLVEYWVRQKLEGRLDVVVTPAFIDAHRPVVDLIGQHAEAGLRLVAAGDDVQLQTTSSLRGLVKNDREHGRTLRRYVERARPNHVVLLYLDHFQVSLGMDLRFRQMVDLSGIYFRPSFHYHRFTGGAMTLRERLDNVRKKAILRLAMGNPHLRTIHSLDPYAVPDVQRLSSRVHVAPLPDGVPYVPTRQVEPFDRESWGVEPDRRIALMFGALGSGKGVMQVLEAASRVRADLQKKLCLAFVGKVAAGEREAIFRAAADARKSSKAQILFHDRYIAEDEIDAWIQASDVLMLTYQRHVGSSGVLIRAAGMQKPVIGSDYGLVGENIRRNRLGVAVDSEDPAAIARALDQFISQPDLVPFDEDGARRFALANASDRFASAIFHHAGMPVSVAYPIPV